MSLIGTQLMSNLFGHTKAEKAFRTWWDLVEDYLIYTLVALGLAVMPTAMVTSSKLECTLCKNETGYCNQTPPSRYEKDPKFNLWWVKQVCTFDGSVGDFMVHFPYILLIIALVLFAIERMFTVVFKEGARHETLYTVLVDRKVIKEEATSDTVDGREIAEIKQSFIKSKGYYVSYLVRTFLELLISTGFTLLLILRGLPMVATKKEIICEVHGFLYECAGHPQELYLVLLHLVIIITICFILCNLYNLVWMFVPWCGKLSRFMSKYRSHLPSEKLSCINTFYYSNYDLHLLLNLLANSAGLAPALAAIAQFDKTFYTALKPKFYGTPQIIGGTLKLQFQGPDTEESKALTSSGATLDIYPEILGLHTESEYNNDNLEVFTDKSDTLSKTFTGLNEAGEFIAKLSTVIDGNVISSVSQVIHNY